MESMETVLLLGRSGSGKTICIANKMQADRRVAPGTSQVTQFYLLYWYKSMQADRLVAPGTAHVFHFLDVLVQKYKC